MSWQDLKQRFAQCGDVKFAEIKMDNGRSKGFGTVKFHTEADAQRAISTPLRSIQLQSVTTVFERLFSVLYF